MLDDSCRGRCIRAASRRAYHPSLIRPISEKAFTLCIYRCRLRLAVLAGAEGVLAHDVVSPRRSWCAAGSFDELSAMLYPNRASSKHRRPVPMTDQSAPDRSPRPGTECTHHPGFDPPRDEGRRRPTGRREHGGGELRRQRRPTYGRPETAARVQAAVEALNYRPNANARALRKGRTEMLGLVAARHQPTRSSPSTPWPSKLAAGAHGYMLVVANSNAEPTRERQIVERPRRPARRRT